MICSSTMKRTTMTTIGKDLIQSLNEALAHAKGDAPAKVHEPVSPRDIGRRTKRSSRNRVGGK